MVELIGAVSSVNNAPPPKASIREREAAPVIPRNVSEINFVNSGIFVDNLQNVAILEYRASETGELINQYPTQAQIDAFKSAQRLADDASSGSTVSVTVPQEAAPQPAAVSTQPPAAGNDAGAGDAGAAPQPQATSVVA